MKRPAPTIDDTAARTALAGFLYGARPNMLNGITVADLCRRYRVSERRAEYELTIARQKRAGEAR